MTTNKRAGTTTAAAEKLFAGPGEMRVLCRDFDWASTSLGPVEEWPLSLRTTVSTLLASKHPMFLWWGSELIQIYNDAYRPSFAEGGRHPRALGAPGAEFWTDIWSIISPEIDQVMSGGEATWHEDALVPIERNGRVEEVWWTYSYGPAFDDDGVVAGVLVVCQETTTRVLTEHRLQALTRKLIGDQARLTAVLDAAPAVMAVYSGPDHVVTYVNPAWERIVGKPGAIGRTFREVFPEMIDTGVFVQLDRVYETGEPWTVTEIQLPMQRAPGGPIERTSWSFTWLPLPGAYPVGPSGLGGDILVHALDVTEQVRARQEIERLFADSERARSDAEGSRERISGLQALSAALSTAATEDQIADVIVANLTEMLDAAGIVVARVTKQGDEVVLLRVGGMPDTIRDQWSSFPLSMPVPLADVVRTGQPLFLESRCAIIERYPDIEPLLDATGHHASAVVPLILEGGVFGVLGAAFSAPRPFNEESRDLILTVARQCAQALERARLFESEREARQLAETANRIKSEFLAVMSHELRTPLGAIDGYAEIMEMGLHGPLTPDQVQDLDRIRKSQRHLLGLINGVLDYARVEAGTVRYAMRDVPVHEALSTCEALIAPQVRAKHLSFNYTSCDTDLIVRADSEKLQQIVLNLLTNAIKFTEPGGRIELGCASSQNDFRITVSDTGRGIPADQLARVFDPFVQVSPRLGNAQDGVGLGLAISRNLARGMAGDLTVQSTSEVGSTFTLILPK